MSRGLFATTPFPNALLDEAMVRLKDTEWRILCVVVRQTLGHYNPLTKARKRRDWLTREQLKQRTGRDSEALSRAIDALVKQNYIVAENKAGFALSTPQERRCNHARVYYRLANRFYTTHSYSDVQSLKSEHTVPPASSLYRPASRKTEHVTAPKPNATKETLTKENVTKGIHQESSDQLASEVFAGALEETQRASTQEILFVGEPEYSGKAQDFVVLFGQLYERIKQHKPDIVLSGNDAERLEKLLDSRPVLDWTPILQAFFSSDAGHITRRDHSLSAFLDSCHIFLVKTKRKSAPSSLINVLPNRTRHNLKNDQERDL